MSEFSVKSAELRNKADALKKYCDSLQSERSNLMNAEQVLMKGFEGDAATAFDKEFRAFDGRMETFKAVAEQYAIKLREQADAYDKADSEAAMRVNSR
jgi:WXG100 family type VII secretion target